MIAVAVVTVGVVWFAAFLTAMWMTLDAPEFSRREEVCEWVIFSFLALLCLLGWFIIIGAVVTSLTRPA